MNTHTHTHTQFGCSDEGDERGRDTDSDNIVGERRPPSWLITTSAS